ncbi:exopolysaccharide biosynthesis polyprenyl glycosylphosphotransferase [Meiothermus sp.]|uniref:exopolysaccharide biosynthesis polyprenyl glycosylphosphotransferase n=1 Tax=Meiothermus sp. TaxID=1955249 RepID=UPI0021DE1605|nr:exopolysaccharide biosynthesis polyprenyl glycosylphosphotransferase [Meiothermus sp.]GIW32706.1 MAG: glycosyl transferase [Meiothermus sp.]
MQVLMPSPAPRAFRSFTASDLLWHGAGIVVCLLAGSLLGWYSHRFWIIGADSYGMVGLIVLSYIGSVLSSRRVLSFAKTDLLTTAFVSILFWFLLTSAVLVLSKWYFSRTYLLGAFMVAFLWQALQLWLQKPNRYRLAVIPGGLADALPGLDSIDWQILDTPRFVQVEAVVMDPYHTSDPRWLRFVAEQSLRGIPLLHAAAVYEGRTGRVSLEHHSEAFLEGWRLPALYPHIKRLIDICAVLLSLPLSLPLMLLVALLVRLDSKGPVLFWQERVGQRGTSFRMVKFRTMRVDAEKEGSRFARSGDDRITRVGRILRKFRLDELPLFWNVLRGEMSIIGPRPEQAGFAEQFSKQIPLYPYRHIVKPGLTGWTQVHHGYAAGADETTEKLTYDLYYVKHLSLWLDMLIVFKTLKTIFTGFGAR